MILETVKKFWKLVQWSELISIPLILLGVIFLKINKEISAYFFGGAFISYFVLPFLNILIHEEDIDAAIKARDMDISIRELEKSEKETQDQDYK